MKKLLTVVLAMLICSYASAAVVISCEHEGEGVVRIDYNASGEGQLVRAFALDITTTGTAKITAIEHYATTPPTPPDTTKYYVYPGSITIVDGEVSAYGDPVAPSSDPDALGGLNTGGITVEMGSLYEVGVDTPPSATGTLCKITVDADCTVNIVTNDTRGGVVLEDASAATVAPSSCVVLDEPVECMKATHPAYADWILPIWGKPDCWCYKRQCYGDSDGIKSGPFWVAVPDLNMFRAAFNKVDALLAGVPNGICSDFDHIKSGPFRVAVPDLNIFRPHFNKVEIPFVPECDGTHINFWTN